MMEINNGNNVGATNHGKATAEANIEEPAINKLDPGAQVIPAAISDSAAKAKLHSTEPKGKQMTTDVVGIGSITLNEDQLKGFEKMLGAAVSLQEKAMSDTVNTFAGNQTLREVTSSVLLGA
ncbi:MAG: hypothetical protein HOA17_00730 [Candidatus Melainabacteria bacterium]|nr:hypothetical protein [Candidatus Melainabacteria bacterium]